VTTDGSEPVGSFRELRPGVVERATWAGTELEVSSFLHDDLPPDDLTSSVRAVLLADAGLAVLHDPNGAHILPGGRRAPGETIEAALQREVAEETGCAIEHSVLMGFIHFRHLTPRPEGYAYPYPEFCQVVFAARGRVVVPDAVDPDGWERVEFVAMAQLDDLSISPNERMYLQAAVEALGQIGSEDTAPREI
jgi:ADP-ribose pyrophosphatase YjhB (NUDIX family)